MRAAKDESMAHENKETKKMEARETRLEKKGYIETKRGKMVKKKKNKKSFPDMSGDGKVTKKDILMARGVIKKGKKK
jgi:hypothetical protein